VSRQSAPALRESQAVVGQIALLDTGCAVPEIPRSLVHRAPWNTDSFSTGNREVVMDVAELASKQAGSGRRAMVFGFAAAARRHEGPERRPPPTLGDVVEAVACETENDSELIAVVVHLFDTRQVQWSSSPAAGPDVWLAH
jgi:hypothetical protein